VEVWRHAFFTSALGLLYSRRKGPGTHWIGGWEGHRAALDAGWRKECCPCVSRSPIPCRHITCLLKNHASFTPQRLYPRGRNRWCPLARGLGPRAGLNAVAKRKNTNIGHAGNWTPDCQFLHIDSNCVPLEYKSRHVTAIQMCVVEGPWQLGESLVIHVTASRNHLTRVTFAEQIQSSLHIRRQVLNSIINTDSVSEVVRTACSPASALCCCTRYSSLSSASFAFEFPVHQRLAYEGHEISLAIQKCKNCEDRK